MALIYFFNKKRRDVQEVSVFDVANYFLAKVELTSGSVMTHLRLQKLCYYAQAWHLAFDHVPMFSERFEAWAHGPVSPDLWDKYKGFGMSPISSSDDFTLDVFTNSQIETLEEVWNAYGQFDAKYLEELTHQENPWILARGDCRDGDKCNNLISNDSMRDYYQSLLS